MLNRQSNKGGWSLVPTLAERINSEAITAYARFSYQKYPLL
jgi:hypothetical protein